MNLLPVMTKPATDDSPAEWSTPVELFYGIKDSNDEEDAGSEVDEVLEGTAAEKPETPSEEPDATPSSEEGAATETTVDTQKSAEPPRSSRRARGFNGRYLGFLFGRK